jgi:hypothetical protein
MTGEEIALTVAAHEALVEQSNDLETERRWLADAARPIDAGIQIRTAEAPNAK